MSAVGDDSVVIGSAGNWVYAHHAVAIGHCNTISADSVGSMLMGTGLSVTGTGPRVVVGTFNDPSQSPSYTKIVFTIGCGTSNTLKSNALHVDNAGNVYIKGTIKDMSGNDKLSTKYASTSQYGLIKFEESAGIGAYYSGVPKIIKATDAEIAAGTHQYHPIVPANLAKAMSEYGLTSKDYISLLEQRIAALEEMINSATT